jgi:hypothetical protein
MIVPKTTIVMLHERSSLSLPYQTKLWRGCELNWVESASQHGSAAVQRTSCDLGRAAVAVSLLGSRYSKSDWRSFWITVNART